MRLHSIRIQNYKSLQDVTLTDLQAVNLLIGPNNSGKSNVLKALEWVKNAVDAPYNTAQSIIKGNVKDTFNKDAANERSFYCIFEGENAFFHIKNFKSAYYPIEGIILENKILTNTNNSAGWNSSFSKILKDYLSKTFIYTIVPSTFSKPTSYLYTNQVNADGSNLVSFLDVMRNDYPLIFKQIIKDLSDCVPSFTEITTTKIGTQGLTQTIRFFDKNNNSYLADEVSEGVLYFLALLCIVHQPEPPKLLLLEEPEKGVHPRRIKEVMDYIFTLAETKDIQIIMTTHSPYVVDEFKDLEECIYIFDRDAAATTVKNLQRDVIQPFNDLAKANNANTFNISRSLGDHWTTGLLGGVPKS